MRTKIKCSDCGYYHPVPSWASEGKAWCRIQEQRIAANQEKTRCKNYILTPGK